MKKIIAKPHYFFFGCTPIFLSFALLGENSTISIPIFAMQFMLSISSLSLFWCFLFLLFGLDYLVLHWIERPPKKGLSAIHILLQIIAIIPFFVAIYFTQTEDKFADHRFFLNLDFSSILILSFVVFLLSIFVHILNFLAGLFAKK